MRENIVKSKMPKFTERFSISDCIKTKINFSFLPYIVATMGPLGEKTSRTERGRPKGKRSSKRDRRLSETSEPLSSERSRYSATTGSEVERYQSEESDPPKRLQRRCRKYYRKSETDMSDAQSSDRDRPSTSRSKLKTKPKKRRKGDRNYDDEGPPSVKFDIPEPRAKSTPKKPKKVERLTRDVPFTAGQGSAITARLRQMGFNKVDARRFSSTIVSSTDDPMPKPCESNSSESEGEGTGQKSEKGTGEPRKITFSDMDKPVNTLAKSPSFAVMNLTGEAVRIEISNPTAGRHPKFDETEFRLTLSIAHHHLVNAPGTVAGKILTWCREMLEDAQVSFWDKNCSVTDLERYYPDFAAAKPCGQPIRTKLKGRYKKFSCAISQTLCVKPFGASAGETARIIQDMMSFSRMAPDDVIKSLNKLFAPGAKNRISYRVCKVKCI